MQRDYLFNDPPRDACPAANLDFTVQSGGVDIYGQILLASCPEGALLPTVLLLHGFPGHEKNIDLGQALRRSGINVAFFSYRGAWGSRGQYAVSHLVEDTCAVLNYLGDNARTCRADPRQLWLVGHSLGGFTALHTLARRTDLCGGVLLAPCDLGCMYLTEPDRFTALIDPEDAGTGCLTLSPGILRAEACAHAADWQFSAIAARLTKPLLFVGAARDDICPPQAHIAPLLARLPHADYAELDDGHGFSASRIALARIVGEWLSTRI